jgi:hypothetical protein
MFEVRVSIIFFGTAGFSPRKDGRYNGDSQESYLPYAYGYYPIYFEEYVVGSQCQP